MTDVEFIEKLKKIIIFDKDANKVYYARGLLIGYIGKQEFDKWKSSNFKPILKQSNLNSNQIVCFTGETSGYVIKSISSQQPPGYFSNDWTPYYDFSWKDLD